MAVWGYCLLQALDCMPQGASVAGLLAGIQRFAWHMAHVVPPCHLPPVTEEVLGPYATHWQPPAHRGRIHGGLSPEPSPFCPHNPRDAYMVA